MTRLEGWEARLHEHMGEAASTAFAWGTDDCALWAARWVRTCTGDDFLSDWEGRYATERGAKLLMKKRGFGTVADIASAHLPEIPVPLARRGDLLLHPQGCLGVCDGRRGVFLAPAGVLTLPALDCPRAWEVG